MAANLLPLPQTGFAPTNADVASHLREQAQWVDEGAYGDVRNVYIVVEAADGQLTRATCGAPCDLARAIGVLTIATARAAMGAE